MTLARPELISLAAGFTDTATLPTREARRLLTQILEGADGPNALQYGSTAGLPRLRTLTVEHLARLDGAKPGRVYGVDRTVMTSGSQQLLYILSEALCDPGDIVLVEDPTYFVYLGILQSHGVLARGVRMEADGLDVDHLEQVLTDLKKRRLIQRLKLLYLVSYYQNPTGITTSSEKKARVLALLREFEEAAGHPLYLLEDAAYRELAFDGRTAVSALKLDTSGERVIYTGTYSKPFATGARIGFGMLPPELVDTVLNIKGNHDFGSANLLQHLLAEALGTGAYDQHLASLRKRYAEKARVTVQSLEQYGGDYFSWDTPGGGLYVWARLKAARTGPRSRFFETSLKRGVLYVPGEYCYADDPGRPKPNHELRLSFGAAKPEDIQEGVRRLALAAKAETRKRG